MARPPVRPAGAVALRNDARAGPRRLGTRRVVLAVWAALLVAAGCRDAPPPRVLLIGLDGADWTIIDRLVAEGQLPHLSGLIATGARADLASMEPMLSPVLWTTMATGRDPDQHGVTWFMVDNPKTGGRMPVTSSVRRVKAFWSILSERRIPVGVIGWWATWPAEVVDGFMVTDFLTYHGFGVTGRGVDTSLGKTHPPELLATIDPLVVDAQTVPRSLLERFVDVPPTELDATYAGGFDFNRPLDHMRRILATAASYRAIALDRLSGPSPPRVTAVYFEGIDSTSHLFMPYAEPRLDWVDDAGFARYRRTVDEFYRYQDEILGELLDVTGENTVVLVVSDHGFLTGTDRPRQVQPVDVPNAHRWHRSHGVLIAAGPGIRPGARLSQASIRDVTPTLLYLLDLPKARDMTGRVLTDLFSDDRLRAHPPTTIPSYEPASAVSLSGGGAIVPPSGVMAEVEERLRALGYIGDSNSSSAEIHGNLARMLLSKGEIDAALESFQRATEMEPLNPQAHRGLATIYRRRGQVRDAVRELRFVVELLPDDPAPRVELGDTLFDAGELDAAEGAYRQALALDAERAGAHIGVGNIARMRGDDGAARNQFDRALALEPDSHVALYNLGVLAHATGDLDGARRYYQRAAALAPGEPAIHNNLAGLYEQDGDLEAALDAYGKARDADPEHFESRYNRGTVLLRLKRYREAEGALKEALALRPDHPDAHGNLALAYLGLGWSDKALKELFLLMRLTPDAPLPYLQASRLLAQSGDPVRARKLLDEALARGSDELRKAVASDPVLRQLAVPDHP